MTKWHGRLLLFAGLSCLLVLGLVAQAGGAWATPDQDALHQTAPTPRARMRVYRISPWVRGAVPQPPQSTLPIEGNSRIIVPDGAVSGPFELEVTWGSADEMGVTTLASSLPSDVRLGATVVQLEAWRDAERLFELGLNNPFVLVMEFTAADLAAAGGDLSKLVIVGYNPETGAWEALPSTIDPIAMTITTLVNNPGLIGLAIGTAVPELIAAARTTLSTPLAGGAAQLAVSRGDMSNLRPIGLFLSLAVLCVTCGTLLWQRQGRQALGPPLAGA